MDKSKVEMFITSKTNMFPVEKIGIIKEKMEKADDSQYMILLSIPLKDPVALLVISIFFGVLGIDRFILGDIGMGLLKLLTGGLCGILTLIDIIQIINKTKEHNYNKLMMVL